MSSAILVGDMHLHNWTRFATTLPDGRNSRFADQEHVLAQITAHVRKLRPRYLIQFGDVFHQRGRVTFSTYTPYVEWVDRLTQIMGRHSEYVTFPGNHDEESVGVHALGPIKVMNNVTVHDVPEWNYLDGFGWTFVVPYRHAQDVGMIVRSPGRLESAKRESGLVLTHYGLHGTPLSTEYELESSLTRGDVRTRFMRGVAGHVHLPSESPEWIDLGAVMHYDFGDRRERGIWHMFVERSQPAFEFIPLEFPVFQTATYPRIPAPETTGFLRVLGTPSARFDEIQKHAIELGWRGCEPVEASMPEEAIAALSSSIMVDDQMVRDYVMRVYAAESESFRESMISFGLDCLREREP